MALAAVYEDNWQRLQQEILSSCEAIGKGKNCRLLVYVLSRFSIDIVVEQNEAVLHVRRTVVSESESELVVTSNRAFREFVVRSKQGQGFSLKSGQILDAHELCSLFLDLACELPSAGPRETG